MRLATGAFRTSPVDSLLADSSEWPLELRRSYLTVNTLLHLKSIPYLSLSGDSKISTERQHAKKLLTHCANSYLRSLDIQLPPLLQYPLPAVAPWHSYTVKVDRSMHSLPEATTPNVILAAYYEMVAKCIDFCVVFTDGSKSNYGVGCSVVLNDDIRPTRFSLPNCFSILSAELCD